MISKSTEDLIASYTEEVKGKLPLRYAISALLAISLYWGSIYGDFKSASLCLLNLSLNKTTDDTNGILNIPIYIYVASFVVIYLLYWFIQKITVYYFKYIANLPKIKDFIKNILSSNQNKSSDKQISEYSIESLTNIFNSTRNKIENTTSNSHFLFVSGFIFIIISFYGNILDFAIGSVLVMCGIYGIHVSCKSFIQDLLPKRAELKRIFLNLTNAAKIK